MYYSDEIVEEIREKNDIVDVIGSIIGLKRTGNSYMCCCPFHNEKTPSFHVSRAKQIYHCFGCGAGGNVITFLMQYENYTFQEALKYLADRSGVILPEVELTPSQKKQESRKEILREINRSAAAYFHYLLTKTDRGRLGYDYYKEKRRLTDETIASFGLGFADVYSDDLYKYLKSKGYSDDMLRDSGLVNFTEKYGAQDVFWNRVMVPITDIGGKVIAFGGRVLGDGLPKYVNTKETEIFNKRRNLFAMHIARRSRRRGIILCEGYMDVIAMHQAGFDNAVASLGTAFTEEQALLIKRYSTEVYLAYDSDSAGRAATRKAIEILRNADMQQRVIDMRPHKDPDEFIKNLGAEEFENRIKDAKPGLIFEIDDDAGKYNQSDPEERTTFINSIARLLKTIEDPVRRNSYLESICNKYAIDKVSLKAQIERTVITPGRSSQRAPEGMKIYAESPSAETPVNRKNDKAEDIVAAHQRLLLTWMVNDPELFERLEGTITEEDFTDEEIKPVAVKLFEQYREKRSVSPAALIDQYDDLEKQQKVAAMISTELAGQLDDDEKKKALRDIVIKVKQNSLDHAFKNSNNDPSKLMELIKMKQSLNRLEV